MRITERLNVTLKNNGELVIMVDGVRYTPVNESELSTWSVFYDSARYSSYNREEMYNNYVSTNRLPNLFSEGDESAETPVEVVELTNEEILERGLSNLLKFFTEFEFTPNYRFVNTLSIKLAESRNSAREYIKQYFALIDNSYKNDVIHKMKSHEFSDILDDLSKIAPTKTVNNRIKIYHGSAGTGKTTKAQSETDNRCIVCNASMLPSDLMEDFVFVNGQPSFKESSLWECIVNGKSIVLDEINLLPFDSLRFLQGICDGKKEFEYKGKKIQIADGFQIIGTMNLTLGGMVYGLPEPLVDRCADIKEFELSASQLMGAIC